LSHAAEWYVTDGKQRFGPYPAETLAEWIALGRVSEKSLVSNGGPWISAKHFLLQHAKRALAEPKSTLEIIEDEAHAAEPVAAQQPSQSQRTETQSAPSQPNPPSQPTAAPPAPETIPTPRAQVRDDAPPDRDRIVVVGRRQSGKTIYLATLYAKLWRSMNGTTAKALSGEVHRQLMTAYHTLQHGEWPAATLGTSRMELEIENRGIKRLMVTLDFAGELFRKAFVEEQVDFPGVKELVEHIDRAAAVVLLVDPSVAAGMDHDAAMDDDFGLVQAVQRIRNWPGGDAVPIVLVLTKMDQNQALLDRFGSAKEFVRQHFPALVRLLKQIPIFQVSAIQTQLDADSRPRPRSDSQPINVENPLQYCLREIQRAEELVRHEREDTEARLQAMKLEREERSKERRTNKLLTIALIIIFVLGAALAVAIVMWQV
jgi:hypothetical protein